MTPLLVSNADEGGGAARAASRLRMALVEQGIPARMKVRYKGREDAGVAGPTGKFEKLLGKLRPLLGDLLKAAQISQNPAPHSPNWLPSLWAQEFNASTADVINLHWLGDETMSVADIGRIRKPVVWTLHDMWPFCGAEHYTDDSPEARWRSGYKPSNRSPLDSGLDLDRLTWRRKSSAWQRPIPLVSPSNWLATCARQSALMSAWPIAVIPNALDTEVFKPLDRAFARNVLNLPPHEKLIVFGAVDGGRDPRKGFDLLQEALVRLAGRPGSENTSCLIFGQSQPSAPPELPLPTRWLGRIHDDQTLALIYNAADVMVVPSRQENLPQTATEALACGCPVAAFNCTGLPDAVEHQRTGYLAEAYDTADLARGLLWLLDGPIRRQILGAAARERALRLWAPQVVATQYLETYKLAVSGHAATALGKSR